MIFARYFSQLYGGGSRYCLKVRFTVTKQRRKKLSRTSVQTLPEFANLSLFFVLCSLLFVLCSFFFLLILNSFTFASLLCIQFAYGRTNFVGGIAASRSHRHTDSTVRPTPGTTDVRIRYSWYEVPYWYEYLLPACMQGDRQEGRHPERIPNSYRKHTEHIAKALRTNHERIPSENEGSRIYM